MTEPEMKLAIGVLVDLLADAAFDGHDLDAVELFDVLRKSGLTFVRPATAEDVENSDFTEIGDDWHALTPFAIECRNLAREPKAEVA